MKVFLFQSKSCLMKNYIEINEVIERKIFKLKINQKKKKEERKKMGKINESN